jgi:hypothetical protein
VSATALVEETSVEAAPAEPAGPAFGAGRLAVLGTAVVVGVPATVEVGRFVTTIVLSLILGH